VSLVPRILILILLVSLALTAAACGNTSATPGVAALGSTTTTTTNSPSDGSPSTGKSKADALASYSACMRSHGVPKFPDPKPSGGGMQLTIGPGHGIDPSSPQFQAAQKACEKLLPGGKGSASPAMQAKAQAQMLKFSACMRAHGLPDFPDPKFSGGGIQMSIGKGLNPSSPVFKAAQKACQSLMPGPKNGTGGGTTQLRQGPSTGSAGAR
jgi:hypothetical protein